MRPSKAPGRRKQKSKLLSNLKKEDTYVQKKKTYLKDCYGRRGVAYVAGSHVARKSAEQAQQEAEQNAQIADLQQQQQAAAAPPTYYSNRLPPRLRINSQLPLHHRLPHQRRPGDDC
jgi:hypothetical protein